MMTSNRTIFPSEGRSVRPQKSRHCAISVALSDSRIYPSGRNCPRPRILRSLSGTTLSSDISFGLGGTEVTPTPVSDLEALGALAIQLYHGHNYPYEMEEIFWEANEKQSLQKLRESLANLKESCVSRLERYFSIVWFEPVNYGKLKECFY